MTDKEALDALRRGDERGMGYLMATHQPAGLRLAYQVTRSREAAEDVVADAFVAVLQNVGSLDAERPFRPWFLRIVANRAITVARRSARLQRIAHLLHHRDWLPGPEEAAERNDEQREVMQALKRLPPEERAALSLRYLLDLDERSIAEVLGCPLGTVKTRLHRGRNRLRRQLGAQDAAPESLQIKGEEVT